MTEPQLPPADLGDGVAHEAGLLERVHEMLHEFGESGRVSARSKGPAQKVGQPDLSVDA